jgi:hypothetical protein
MNEMNIYQRIDAITAELAVVAKNLTVQTGKSSSYKAVGERDIIDAVKPLEHKYGVVSFPVSREILDDTMLESEGTDYKGNPVKRTTFYIKIRTKYRFVNIDNPQDFIETETISDGIDSGDKGGGKAMTYGDKYALMKVYKISTGEDPDQTASTETTYTQNTPEKAPNSPEKPSEPKKRATDPQIKTIRVLAEKAGLKIDAITKKPLEEFTVDEATQMMLELRKKVGD